MVSSSLVEHISCAFHLQRIPQISVHRAPFFPPILFMVLQLVPVKVMEISLSQCLSGFFDYIIAPLKILFRHFSLVTCV